MNLSKLTLQWLVYHAQHSDVAGYTEVEIIKEIDEALEKGTLEIEGERVQWTKLNPNDPKTFPPDDKIVLAYGLPDPRKNRSCAVYFFAWADSAGMFLGQESADPEVHFWRPLPPAPVETEAKK